MKHLLIILAALTSLQSRCHAPHEPERDIYLFSYFIGNGEDGLHLSYSEDGYNFEHLAGGRSYLAPGVGKDKLMRDPNIVRGGDGKFHMVWTVSWTDKGVGYACSDDLINWSEQQFIPVMAHEPEARNTWAPEIFYDKDDDSYMIYWSTTIRGRFPETQLDADDGYNHRKYYVTTKDFKEFSETKLLYEPGFNVIDGTIIKEEGEYIMFVKDETREPAEKNIRITRSKQLTGGYGPASEPITGDYWAEGPTAAKVEGQWVVYFDKYIDKKMGAVASSDLENWTDISEKITFPKGTRHGSVVMISRDELAPLLAK
ncbi:glycoside hydrolase family 43 protein [Anditalea andensis]|uniref:Beta-galactosidase n=1 Tax=Anditalea andensis TaxID=1048983 RepID=A0A074L3F4_9BACT|nr:glycoside hydrolase family 43 protein [Anditalea andensis]KEO75694.1 beta-galactosidase [Anditalea andensis]